MVFVSCLTIILLNGLLLSTADSAYVGNDWPGEGSVWLGFPNSIYIMNTNGPSIPYDGHIHAFHAQIMRANSVIKFQIWRPESGSYTLIGQESYTTTEDQTMSHNTTFFLSESIEVKQGDQIGFWSQSASVAVSRYATSFKLKAVLFKDNILEPTIGGVYSMSTLNNFYNISLAVTLETDPIVKNDSALTTSPSEGITTSGFLSTTREPVPRDREYGRPLLKGEFWKSVAEFKFLSFIINFTEPIIGGYLNRLQIYSVKRGVDIKFQIWRTINNNKGSRAFLLVNEFPHTTRLIGGFENTTIWNADLLNGDLIGVAVVDSSSTGFPIGWQLVSGSGERIYRKETSSKIGLPMLGITYRDYEFLNIHNQLAIAAYVSDEKKAENDTVTVPVTSTEIPGSSNTPQTTTPLNDGSTTPLNSEITIGNKDVVYGPDAPEEFQPFDVVTMILSDMAMRRDGYVTEIGFYAGSTEQVEIGIYRRVRNSCSKPRCYKKIHATIVSASEKGPYIINFDQLEGGPLPVSEGDVLGFYNMDPSSMVIGRIGVGGNAGDKPFLTLGPTNLEEVTQGFNMHILGYKYAIFAVMAEVPTTTTTSVPTTTTTTAPTTTTTTAPTTTTTTPTRWVVGIAVGLPSSVVIVILVIVLIVIVKKRNLTSEKPSEYEEIRLDSIPSELHMEKGMPHCTTDNQPDQYEIIDVNKREPDGQYEVIESAGQQHQDGMVNTEAPTYAESNAVSIDNDDIYTEICEEDYPE